MPDLTRETLLNVGFVDVAAWHLSGEDINYELDGERAQANEVLLDNPNALYAFVRDEAVQYIGKTTMSVRKRFFGYRKPGKGQQTNLRCNARIKGVLKKGAAVRILVFTPISDLRYLEFEVNLAAGLEDALIKAFNPPWNGHNKKGKPITEEAEREAAEEKVDTSTAEVSDAPVMRSAPPAATFVIKLRQAYYHQGLLNPGVEASKYLGADGEPVQVLFDDGTEPVLSRINRTANPSGSVRIVGRNRQIADWFQAHFKKGDVVHASVIDPNRILLTRHPEPA